MAATAATRAADDGQARIAITLDLEMSRGFPTRDQVHWDDHKGELDAASRAYAVRVADRVAARGGRVHAFLVGRTLEQGDTQWLRAWVRQGHRLGNHTYDHVNIKATRTEDLQPRSRRCPWLGAGVEPARFIRSNIHTGNLAIRTELRTEPAGFRTPGGFAEGLDDRPDLQNMLLDLGFKWVSSRYPAPPMGKPRVPPDDRVFRDIVAAQARAQPSLYPSGLVEIPMSPPSDIAAFRDAEWSLPDYLKAVRAGVEWAIEHRAVYDFIAHPSCLGVVDPELQTIDLVCDLVGRSKGQARLVDLDAVALGVSGAGPRPAG
jgi:peptidoglycan/xylan/chitin deacetylase (PgdA/CDA1 family)